MKKEIKYCFIGLFFLSTIVFSQNETSKWCFGVQAGLNFMTSPPTVFTNSITTGEGCASVADAAGNLLFYTDGTTLWNQNQQVMANGSGLFGSSVAGQSSLIIKKPGSTTLYFVFTQGVGNGLHYSIVDMSLAAGLGSVTVLNNPMVVGNETEKLTGTRHCNGTDYWVVTHGNSANDFSSYLLTPTGLNPTPVISLAGATYVVSPELGVQGSLKISSNGKKLAAAIYAGSANVSSSFELFDFNNSNGVVSNPVILANGLLGAYGCEFSPDNTKFYGSRLFVNTIYQWDLCAPTGTANIPSVYTYTWSSPSSGLGEMQRGSDDKIYISRYNQQSLMVINNPNVAGIGFNPVVSGQSISPNTNSQSLPNFMNSSFNPHPLPPPFTYTANNTLGCQSASFTAPFVNNMTLTPCSVNGYSLVSVLWNFGDPASGINNTSTLNNPLHTFSSLGTFTTQLILYYSCTGGTDTLRQVVNINQSCISVNSTSITCANLGSATVTPLTGTGPYSYTWMPTNQNNAVAIGLSPGTYTIKVFDPGNNFTYSSTTVFTSLIPLTGTLNVTPSISCNGASTGTANYTNLAGGSVNQNYLWSNGTLTYTIANPINLSAGTWSSIVTDALTGCAINNTFVITQPPALTLNIVASTPTTCAGTNITLTGTNTGGTPGYTYVWATGPPNASYVVNQLLSGSYIYTLNSSDAYSCSISNTIAVNFVPNPTITVANVSICPLQTGILNAIGATTYTWSNNSNGSSLSDNPLVSLQYSVTGAALGCSAIATASIIVMPVPVPIVTSNAPRCNGDNLLLNGAGGVSYNWDGPTGYNSSAQNPTISPVALSNAGIYNVTVTAANSCTATTNTTVVVNSTPTLSASGSTVCMSQTMSLTSSSGAGTSYNWSGPLNFSSALQYINITSPSLNQSGVYNLTVTSIDGCTNTASALVSVVLPPNLSVSLSSPSMCAQALSGSPNTVVFSSGGATSYTIITPNHISNTNPNGPSSNLSLLPPYVLPGPATATLVGSNGVCTMSLTSTFTVIPNPTVSINSATPVICSGQSFTYTSNGANSYTWSSPNSNNYIYTTGNIAVTNPSINSVFSVVGGSLGCLSALQSSNITVNPLPTFSIIGNANICPGTSASLSAVGTGTMYNWSPSSFLNSTSSATVMASPPALQNYVVVGSLNNCTNTAMITVSVLPLPVAQIIAPKTIFCQDEQITLFGSGGPMPIGAYTWNGPPNNNFTGKDLQLKAISSAFGGTYTLTVSDQNNCKGSVIQAITVNNLPQGYLSSPNMQGCAPLCADLSFKSNNGNAPITDFKWQIENNNFSGSNFKYCFNSAGNYTIAGDLTDINNCANTVTAIVNVYPKPKADFDFYPEQPIENFETVQFKNASIGANQFHWVFDVRAQANNFGNSTNSSIISDPTFLFETTGLYPVVLVAENQWSCVDTIIKVIHVEPDFAVYVPNAFTPNQDGLNEMFIPVLRGNKDFTFTIFDRWGKKIFETSELTKGWDGTFKGEVCKQDVYVWKLIVSSESTVSSDSGKETKNLAGEVLLYR